MRVLYFFGMCALFQMQTSAIAGQNPIPFVCALNLASPKELPEKIVMAYAKILELLRSTVSPEDFDHILSMLELNPFHFETTDTATVHAYEAMKKLETISMTCTSGIRPRLELELKKSRDENKQSANVITDVKTKVGPIGKTLTSFKPPNGATTLTYLGESNGRMLILDSDNHFSLLNPATGVYENIEIPNLSMDTFKNISVSKDAQTMIIEHKTYRTGNIADKRWFELIDLSTKSVRQLSPEWVGKQDTKTLTEITNIVMNPDGKTALASLKRRSATRKDYYFAQIQMTDIATGKVLGKIDVDSLLSDDTSIYRMGASEGGEWIWMADNAHFETTRLYRKTGAKYKEVWSSAESDSSYVSVVFNPQTGEPIMHSALRNNGQIRQILRWNGKAMTAVWQEGDGFVNRGLQITPDGKYVAFTRMKSNKTTFKLFDLESNSVIYETDPSKVLNYYAPAGFTEDGNMILNSTQTHDPSSLYIYSFKGLF